MKNNTPKYLIPNVTSASNVGDAAMLEVLIQMILDANQNAKITIHSSEPDTYSKKRLRVSSIKQTLYYWSTFVSNNPFERMRRLMLLIIGVLSCMFSIETTTRFIKKTSKQLYEILNDYRQADYIVAVGGGYLRSKKGVTQALNLIMLLLPFVVARLLKKKVIVSPISVGPFGYNWQAILTARILKHATYLSVREHFSFKQLASFNLPSLVQASDHALLTSLSSRRNKSSKKIIGFTIREWLPSNKQEKLELAYAQALSKISKEGSFQILPIIQVDAPRFGEGDANATQRVADLLKKMDVYPSPQVTIESVDHAKKVYGNIHILVGMRMHSNILAATQGTPFIAISYEYKTEGIAHDLDLDDYCIASQNVTKNNLLSALRKVIKNRDGIIQKMNKRLETIKSVEKKRWSEVFKQ